MTRFKSFATGPNDLVLSSLKGLVAANPVLTLMEDDKVVLQRSGKDKVMVVSGGGSGHEPSHAGYVGEGMLDAAVCGSIFASPSTKQIISALSQFPSSKGFVLVVKNYTGDILHFGLAAEKLKAKGLEVELVIVGDDVAVGKAKGGLVGRRGLAGTILVHKTAGAAAESGLSISEVSRLARTASENIVTIGASLDHCCVPGRDPSQQISLGPDEIEIGMGIHNESGVEKLSSIPTREELVQKLLRTLVSSDDIDRSFVPFHPSDEVVLLVNNLGGISNLELGVFVHLVASQLRQNYKLKVVRILAGTFMTALDGPGFSITLLNLTRAGDDRILELLDLPSTAPGWTVKQISGQSIPPVALTASVEVSPRPSSSTLKANPDFIKSLLFAACRNIAKNEPQITQYDTVAGDGDCGITLLDGCNGIIRAIQSNEICLDNVVQLVLDVVDIVENCMGGTSGGIYAIFLSALAQALGNNTESSELDVGTLSRSLMFALDTLYRYTRARPGDRTLIDSLAPFVATLVETSDLCKAVAASRSGFENTRKLQAKFGRASYVSDSAITNFDDEGGLPDPGALGVVVILEGFLSVYKK
ncbi:Dak1 domain-containing protein [Lipomyces kononenkoae]|uniref:Dak1 domain-containing protein n=1 Tax=Lipomyces kononenkoae TaxID=34357 RepID=A0ACC3SQQ5_LIPKO